MSFFTAKSYARRVNLLKATWLESCANNDFSWKTVLFVTMGACFWIRRNPILFFSSRMDADHAELSLLFHYLVAFFMKIKTRLERLSSENFAERWMNFAYLVRTNRANL